MFPSLQSTWEGHFLRRGKGRASGAVLREPDGPFAVDMSLGAHWKSPVRGCRRLDCVTTGYLNQDGVSLVVSSYKITVLVIFDGKGSEMF